MTYTFVTQLLTFSTVPVAGTYNLVLTGNGTAGPIQWNSPGGDISAAFLSSTYGSAVSVVGNTTTGITIGFIGAPIRTLPLLAATSNSLVDVDGNPVVVTISMLSTVELGTTAQTYSNNNLAALKAQANQEFINQFQVAQAQATLQGKTVVYLSTFRNCDIVFLSNYFQNLGYYITYPDVAPINGAQPAELFGPAWIAYWENQVPDNALKPFSNPTRIGIAWSPPNFQFLPLFDQEV
jgi:hypothetical protein